MAGVAKNIIKYPLLFALTVDIVALVVSLISLESVSSVFWYKVVYTIKHVRFELLLLLLVITLCLAIVRYYPSFNRTTKLFFYCTLVYTLIEASPFMLSLAKGRYYFHNNDLLSLSVQRQSLHRANAALRAKRYSEASKHYKVAIELSPGSHYNHSIQRRVNTIERRLEAARKLFEISQIQEAEDRIKIDQLNTLYYCYYLTKDGFYQDCLEHYEEVIRIALANYSDLHQACRLGEEAECQRLFEAYGWCYFEPEQIEYITRINDRSVVLGRISNFVLSENPESARRRLHGSWIHNGDVDVEIL